MDRPILFSAPMIRAILAGQKTQTRRVVKPPYASFAKTPEFNIELAERRHVWLARRVGEPGDWKWIPCPYGQPGDRLWVRETFYCDNAFYPDGVGVNCMWREVDGKRVPIPVEEQRKEMFEEDMYYRADGDPDFEGAEGPTPWRPSIHMPRWASRITLEITGVRVERLQAISEEDAMAEGIEQMPCGVPDTRLWRNYTPDNGWTPRVAIPQNSFRSLWSSINGVESWDANPWVWVVEFQRAES